MIILYTYSPYQLCRITERNIMLIVRLWTIHIVSVIIHMHALATKYPYIMQICMYMHMRLYFRINLLCMFITMYMHRG